jgi:hypothetical protein
MSTSHSPIAKYSRDDAAPRGPAKNTKICENVLPLRIYFCAYFSNWMRAGQVNVNWNLRSGSGDSEIEYCNLSLCKVLQISH